MRQVIERVFALLKGRFRRLKYLHMNCADLIPFVILACCVLHNICLEGCEDDIDDFILNGMEQDVGNNDDADGVIPDRLCNDQRGLSRVSHRSCSTHCTINSGCSDCGFLEPEP